MCAYNQVNGTFSCNNAQLLSELGKWGFAGAVTPDAVFALHDPLKAERAGVTYIGPEKTIRDLLTQHQLTEQDLDRMLYAALFPVFKLGIYDSPAPGNAAARVSTSEHLALAKRIVEEGSVLLKNQNHLLPISPDKVKSIAIIGVAAGKQAIVGEEGPTVYVEKLSVPAEAIIARAGSSVQASYYAVGMGIRPLPLLSGDILTPSGGSGHGLSAAYLTNTNRTVKRSLQEGSFAEIFVSGPFGMHHLSDLIGTMAKGLRSGAPAGKVPSEAVAEAAMGAVWGIVHHCVAEGRATQLPQMSPLLSFLALTPMIGPEPAAAAVRLEHTARP